MLHAWMASAWRDVYKRQEQGRTRPDLSEIFDDSSKAKVVKIDPAQLQKGSALPVLGAVPWSFDLIATRAIDMAHHLNLSLIHI